MYENFLVATDIICDFFYKRNVFKKKYSKERFKNAMTRASRLFFPFVIEKDATFAGYSNFQR